MRVARAALVLATVASCAACAGHVAPDDLLTQIRAGTAPPILDVRSRAEYDAGHVPGAIHVPFHEALGAADELPARAPGEPLVVYCAHGPRAGIARAELWLAGAGEVVFLEGHMTGWRQAGLPVETGEGGE